MSCGCNKIESFRKVAELTIVPSYSCPFDCKYCFVKENETLTKKIMTRETVDAIIDYFIPEKINKTFTLWFFGGEPLSDKEIIKYTTEKAQKAAQQHGVQLTVGATTNGFYLDENFVKWCKENNFQLLISYDGHENQRIFRGREGSRERDAVIVENNIRRCGDLLKTAAVQLSPGGLANLYNNIMTVFDLGFSGIAMNKITGKPGVYSEKDFKDLEREMGKLTEFVKKEQASGGKRRVEFLQKQLDFLCDTSFLAKRIFQHDKSCGAAKGSLSIGPTGNLYPCQRLHFSGFKLGNVHTEVMRVAKREKLARHHPSGCQSCEVKCAPCYASNYESGRNIYNISSDECRYERLLYQAAKKIIDYQEGEKKNEHEVQESRGST